MKNSDLKIGKINVTSLLRDKYKSLKNGWVAVLQVPAEEMVEVNAESLKVLIDELDYECIYITISKSKEELEGIYKSRGVNLSKIRYIDCISRFYGNVEKSNKKVIYTSGPLDINSITIALRDFLQTSGEQRFVFLDSITTLLIYNTLQRTKRFSKFMSDTLRRLGVQGVMVSVPRGDATKELIDELKKFCDEVIVIGGDFPGIK